MSDHLNCSYPFDSLFVDTKLDVSFCCAGKIPLGNLNDSPLAEIMHGKLATEVRAAQFTDSGHDYCSGCTRLMSKGVKSQRMEIVPDPNRTLTPEYYKLKRIDIRWGNTCNLSCNYCMPYFSSKWASIMNDTSYRPISSTAEKQVFAFIEKNIDTASDLMLLGGEPFLQKQNERLLDMLPNKSICLITNLSIPIESNSIAKRLMEEPFVEWGVSFENIGDKFEYVRHGASWEVVEANLKLLKLHGKKVCLFPLYCVYSALDLVELYDMVVGNEYVSHIEWQLLTTDELDVMNMSAKIRQLAIDEIERCVAKYSESSGVSVLKKLQKKLLGMTDSTTNMNTNLLARTALLEKQMKKKMLFSELWTHYDN